MTHTTKSEITGTLSDGSGTAPKTITVPAGTRVSPCNDGTGQWFVEDLSWLERDSLDYHDANYRGIRIAGEHVASCPT